MTSGPVTPVSENTEWILRAMSPQTTAPKLLSRIKLRSQQVATLVVFASYRLIRPIVRPLMWRFRGFLIQPVMQELKLLREQLASQTQTIAAFEPTNDDLPKTADRAIDTLIYATEQDVVSAYRLVLGREPDSEGIKGYRAFIASGKVPVTELTSLFLSSSEYLQKRQKRLAATRHTVPVKVHGFQMLVAPAWNHISRQIHQTGAYEPHITREILTRLRPGAHFVDVGANIGYFTLLACSVGAKAWAFEPGQRNLKMLIDSLRLNGFRAEVFPTAVADQSRTILYTTASGIGVIDVDVKAPLADDQTVLRAVTLDDVLAGHRIDMIKMDVEGAEGLVFRGASKVLSNRPTILFEFCPSTLLKVSAIDPVRILEELCDLGYSLSIVESGGCLAAKPHEIPGIIDKSDKPFIDLLAEV